MENFESRWEPFFKSEARSAGRTLSEKGVVNLSQPSDTELTAFIRVSSPVRVSIQSPSIESRELSAKCACPLGRKGQLCKHVWATLLQAGATREEFFEGKSSISASPAQEMAAPTAARPKLAPPPLSAAQQEAREAMKERANQYRRDQYQAQKQRLKAQKTGGKASRHARAPEWPDDVKAALQYFNANGFEFSTPPQADEVQNAKKKLSRIFHPDRGGQHDEILELNHQSDLLLEFIETL